MLRKSKSSAPTRSSTLKPTLSTPNLLPSPRHRLQTASDSNLSGGKISQRDSACLNLQPTVNERRVRRTSIATGSQRQPLHVAQAVPSPEPKVLLPAPTDSTIGRRIVEYMPELFEEVAPPIRLTGVLFTWEDPSRLDYVPLPPPPRKNFQCGRILSKPQRGPDVCSRCSSKKSFSCGSSRHEPNTGSALPTAVAYFSET
ncbi:hypothetical protein DFH07DRAFT_828336 [Mycena maculata]|uniref:Uncharacterized protein n=1 Tax=Mycena maculata TaxID=230809 RepID=A0AAD7ITP5_9AGAR|nr:hypothetical protein DFH07DRAFT_828336 [Mycena maculata]